MEIIVYAVVAGILALWCCVLAAKLCEKDREIDDWKARAIKFKHESNVYWRKYTEEEFENAMLRSRVGRLERIIQGVDVNRTARDEGDV